MIAVELASVHPSSRCPLIAYDERTIPQYKALTDAVHEHGARIVLQIGHTGRQRLAGSRLTWAASPIPYQFFDIIGLTPKEMEIEEIHEVVEGWGRAAALAKASGFDGVWELPPFRIPVSIQQQAL
jgi:2,4-dienoyl-CoA reductase-like NADH-dependent reductase (Old Yellow Enzyme family)